LPLGKSAKGEIAMKTIFFPLWSFAPNGVYRFVELMEKAGATAFGKFRDPHPRTRQHSDAGAEALCHSTDPLFHRTSIGIYKDRDKEHPPTSPASIP
jgi:hypothetical protein